VLLARLANVGAGMVFVLVTARSLGPAGRGEIAVAFTIAWATTNVSDLGTSTSGRISLLRPNSEITARDVLSLTVVLIPLQAGLTVVLVLLLSLTSLNLSMGFGVAIVALSVATMMFNSVTSIVYGLRRYGDVLTVEATLALYQVVLITGLLWANQLTAVSAVGVMAVGPALGAIWLAQISGAFRRSGTKRCRSSWRTLVVDGLSPMAGGISLFLALRVDRIVLAVVAGTQSLGLFTVALAVPETLRLLPKAVGQVIADRGRSGIDTVAVARRRMRLFVVGHGLVLAVAAAAGWFLMPVVLGEGFAGARDVLIVVTVAEAVLAVHLMHQALLVGFGRPKGIGPPQVVGAAVMVVIVLVMIPAWGLQGAAWASLLGYTAMAGTSMIWTNRELRRLEA
jgi:O-antigen/teichoic acid export membrane protein